nr:response regulator [Pseudobutyrivibrio sp.]
DECTLRISVKDTGIGVKPEDIEKLFTAYERLDEKRNSGIQGTGLGLDISRRFAELMNASLTCESEYGHGSEFIFVVTQKVCSKETIGKFTEHDNDIKKRYLPEFIAPEAKVLVVDDNSMNQQVIKGLLKATKTQVTLASSGEECLRLLKDNEYHVVLLDHMMPVMDGIQTLAQIRLEHKTLPVYALTANAASGEDFYKSKGFDGYLPKPIDSKLLELTIKKHLPEELLQEIHMNDVPEEVDEMPGDKLWVYDVPGLSVPAGIENTGGISAFLYALKLFYDTIDTNLKNIVDAYLNEDIKLYTIKVHALKSSARIIGAADLSKMCEQLENAGNKEDLAYIYDNHEPMINEFKTYKEKLKKFEEAEDQNQKTEIDSEELKSAIEALKEVVPAMDFDAVEMIVNQLEEYKLPEPEAGYIKKLKELMKTVDWDGMDELISKW